MSVQRPSTPPAATASGKLPKSPLTPEQIRKIEINRLKAKALRNQREAATKASGDASNASTGQKRPYAALSASATRAPTSTNRDARNESPQKQDGSKAGGDGGSNAAASGARRPLDSIQPARNFSKFVEYDFSKMTDTKGGFLTTEDDPHNKALRAADADEEKPAHMTMKEWERHKLLRKLREERKGPFEPGREEMIAENKPCRECGGLEIDWKWEKIFKLAVCNTCKEKLPERYSLLTKTEAKEDYLLTDSELRDEELLPHLEKPNPHKATWNNMMLFLRCQVEEYAIQRKWGSEDALDAAYEKRQADAKRRRSEKFKNRLQELKKRTRVEAWKRAQNRDGDGGDFGDIIGGPGKHVHDWGRPEVDDETGVSTKTCVECGMELEELEF